MSGFLALWNWYPNVDWEIDHGLTGKPYGIVRNNTCYVSPAQAFLLDGVDNLDELAFILSHLPFRRDDVAQTQDHD